MTDFENYIENSEIVQLAILEATHRYFYDKCFDKNNRLKEDDETNKISAIYKELWCKYPDWRAKIKKRMDRYPILADIAFVKSMEITNKPDRNFCQILLIHFAEKTQPF